MEIYGKEISNLDSIFVSYFEFENASILSNQEAEILYLFQSMLEAKEFIPYSQTFENKTWTNTKTIFYVLNWLDRFRDIFKHKVLNQLAWEFLDKLRDRGRTVEIQKRLLETVKDFVTSDLTVTMPRTSQFCGEYEYKIHEQKKKDCIHLIKIYLNSRN